ncbi:GyrI-like domain-containing protein [Lentilactobacillus sp. SPB1-3]|uniref:GyrI-like domain-containing protein n=1 Tax=Lentilactobacillus terminaliae TaxID=3003483 RepID=A0ACD5DGS6_9LACO|nr:GyrI-like domain-containing protein [Lentilactobacillus sp. SPB1-3]MCZ0977054.1 GyrI-like domain-containing protein [Lentilactobacillus sp. SPB1-3]
MTFDVKKEEKQFYSAKGPELIKIPSMDFMAIRGTGNPNDEGGAYQRAVQTLYAVAYTIRMSEKAGISLPGYEPYVVSPLEGLWWQDGYAGVDLNKKSDFQWWSMIRLPRFASHEILDWAKNTAAEKKKIDTSDIQWFTYDEGLVVQAMHHGPYATEPETVSEMNDFVSDHELKEDFSTRYHHEVYLSDPRKIAPEKMKTILRHPVKK